jgi:hypothetical protein
MQGNVLAVGAVRTHGVAGRSADGNHAARAYACRRFVALLRRRLGPENGTARPYDARADRGAPGRPPDLIPALNTPSSGF